MFRYTHFQPLASNAKGRDFILADLHGCYEELLVAMTEVGFDRGVDRILSVGDLIDRGEDSLNCLKLLKEDWFFSVQGNHENMMLGGIKAGPGSDPWKGWMNNGGEWYSKLTRKHLGTIKTLLPLVTQMPITAIVNTPSGKRVGLSHAQPPIFDWSKLNDGYRLSGDEIWRAMWSREVLRKKIETPVKGVDITFHGHTIVKRPHQIANMHFIDIGFYVKKRVELIEVNEALFADKKEIA
jgi:serine/threonine protein phosphatase 1